MTFSGAFGDSKDHLEEAGGQIIFFDHIPWKFFTANFSPEHLQSQKEAGSSSKTLFFLGASC